MGSHSTMEDSSTPERFAWNKTCLFHDIKKKKLLSPALRSQVQGLATRPQKWNPETRSSPELTDWLPWFSSFHFSHSVVSGSLQPHGLQHAGLPCPSPTPKVYSNSCPSSQWCHPTISYSVIPFPSRLQSFPASMPFPMSQFFASGGQSIGVSASASVLLRIFRTDFL